MSTVAQERKANLAHIGQIDGIKPHVAERKIECALVDDARRLRKYSCMKPVGRRCVHARPDFSRYSSIALCIRPKGNAVSDRASKPENLITWRTPAALQASINVHCVSTISMSEAEIMRARSTPSRADPMLFCLDISPSTISTVGTFSSSFAFSLFLTKIRRGSRCRTNSFAMMEPAEPVA